MSLLRTCPKCHRESLDSNSFRVWCLYATSCGYSIPPATNSTMDARQEHSDEPTTEKEREERKASCVCWFCRHLIADIARLNRQLSGELTADSVLCPHAPNHILEAKCKELEAENKRLRDEQQRWLNHQCVFQ